MVSDLNKDILLKRWKDLLKRVGCDENVEDNFMKIKNIYSLKSRRYHNLQHIVKCLEEFDLVEDKLAQKDTVELAVWFHDIIYKTRSDTNEEDSAVYAKRILSGLGVDDKIVQDVYNLIIATKHDTKIVDPDAKYLVDIDLSILGVDKDQFLDYEKNIRKEYSWVPYFFYKKKRFEILKNFLERKFIFSTDFFRQRYELKARANLNSILKTYRKIYPD